MIGVALLVVIGTLIKKDLFSENPNWPFRIVKNDLGTYFIQKDFQWGGYTTWRDIYESDKYEDILSSLEQFKQKHAKNEKAKTRNLV